VNITLREWNLNAIFQECPNKGKIEIAANLELMERFVYPNHQIKTWLDS